MVGRAQPWWIGAALWVCWALGLAMFALGGGAQTASIVAFQFAPATLVAPLWLLRKPRPGPCAADGCHAVRWSCLWEAEASVTALHHYTAVGRIMSSNQLPRSPSMRPNGLPARSDRRPDKAKQESIAW